MDLCCRCLHLVFSLYYWNNLLKVFFAYRTNVIIFIFRTIAILCNDCPRYIWSLYVFSIWFFLSIPSNLLWLPTTLRVQTVHAACLQVIFFSFLSYLTDDLSSILIFSHTGTYITKYLYGSIHSAANSTCFKHYFSLLLHKQLLLSPFFISSRSLFSLWQTYQGHLNLLFEVLYPLKAKQALKPILLQMTTTYFDKYIYTNTYITANSHIYIYTVSTQRIGCIMYHVGVKL